MLNLKQWIGLAVVTTLAVGTVVFIHLVPQRPLPELSELDTLAAVSRPEWKDSTYSRQTRYPKRQPIAIRRRHFNPNTADSTVLLEQGLKPWQVGNLLKYRRAGGVFRKRSDMRRLYGLDETQYRAMEGYIDLPDSLPARRDTTVRDTTPRYVSIKRDTVLELNTADTAELQLLRGIGRWTAKQIVRYREQLGGYVSTGQLYEIQDIDARMLDTVVRRFTVDTMLVRKIDVNRCSASTLSRHPYLRFEQAQAIYELRRRRVSLSSMDDLRSIPLLRPEDIELLRPYLLFGHSSR